MRILIPKECEYYFVTLVVRKIKRDIKAFIRTQTYFNKVLKEVFSLELDIDDIVDDWLNSISVLSTKDYWVITSNNTKMYKNTRIKTSTLIAFICNGNTKIRGVSFIQKYLSKTQHDIRTYYIVWKRIGNII